MGTSGAYSGAGGAAGKQINEGLGEWLDSLSGAPESDGAGSTEVEPQLPNQTTKPLPPKVVSGLMGLLSPRRSGGSADGPGGGGGSGAGGGSGGGRVRTGSGRSSQRLSTVGGRAAAGAYAFARGDAEGLRGLGLDYGELRSLNDPLEVTKRIVDAVCGPRSNSQLEGDEERYVAAAVADWVLEQSEDGSLPEADEVARYGVATILAELISSELGEALRERPDEVADVAEDELRDAAGVLAAQASFTSSGPSAEELTAAIEGGLETLRSIYGSTS